MTASNHILRRCRPHLVSVGTLTRTYLNNKGEALKSTVDGTDSTTTVDGSKYKFTIDQLKREIYNADSLPAGTAVSKVVCSLASKNSGVVYVKRMASDTLDYFTGNDSIDFKDKRVFRVYSTDGQSYRDYNVEIRVHKELADSFEWQREDVSNILPDLGKYKGVKIFAMGENVFAMVNDGATSFVMRKGINDNSRWNTVTPNVNTVFRRMPTRMWRHSTGGYICSPTALCSSRKTELNGRT